MSDGVDRERERELGRRVQMVSSSVNHINFVITNVYFKYSNINCLG